MFADDFAKYGPGASPHEPPSPRQARRYCRRLARRHYENFTVLGWLLPGALKQHVANIYAYCRWADDLADEPGEPQERLERLRWWEGQLHLCYQGRAVHPVFVALSQTLQQFEIPPKPLVDLLVAFRQDQRTTRYETFDALLDYCRYSANPVGHLVLYLARCHDEGRARWSDAICTGLQLANFWQDVARDWDAGRIYLPLAHCCRFGYHESDFHQRRCNEPFRRMLAAEVAEAEGYLRRGLPLVERMPKEWQLQTALFAQGGLAILEAIRRRNYDVWTSRPVVSRWKKLELLAGCWWRLRRGTFSKGGP